MYHSDPQILLYSPLASIDFLAGIEISLVAALGAFDTLAVNNAGTGVAFAPSDQSHMFSQVRMNLNPQSTFLPEPEVMINRVPRSKVLRHIAPLAASFDDVKDGGEQCAERMFAGSPLLLGFWKTILDQLPFGLGQIR